MRQYMDASTYSAKRFNMLYGGTRREDRILRSLAGITDPNAGTFDPGSPQANIGSNLVTVTVTDSNACTAASSAVDVVVSVCP